ncbi:hypothetical protein OF83DRAFT_1141088 [Amylostereum chailletii]|nr:hypothetical protein OF83DRAFT_1141088 [Amylostereum chailletii]
MSSSALALNSAIIVASDDGFHVNLPDIQSTTWSSILFNRHKPIDAENERLEFIGDALIYLCVALDVYERCPDASPGFLTHTKDLFFARSLAYANGL